MKPTDFFRLPEGHQPTVVHFRAVALRTGVDRLCLVRQQSPAHDPALALVLFGDKAASEIMPLVDTHRERCCRPEACAVFAGDRCELDIGSDLTRVMKILDEEACEFMAARLELPDGCRPMVVFIMAGVDAVFAAQLTALRCTCNLT